MSRSTGFAATPFAVFITILLSIPACAQEVRSVLAGPWNSPLIWSSGEVPDVSTVGRIVIDHHVVIPDGHSISCNELLVNDTLTIASSAQLTLMNTSAPVDMQVNGRWIVAGSFVQKDDAVVSGTSSGNSVFLPGSDYYYLWNIAGILPVVSWDAAATFHITAFDTNASVTSDTWTQNFGNVIYDCPAQGNFMDFNGRLRNIQGDFIIRSTNHHILRLARGHSFTLDIDGNFIIEGPSEVWLGETGNAVVINVGKNFEFRAQATASSYLTLSGNTQLAVNNNFILDTSYKLKFASSGGGHADVHVGGDLDLQSGTMDALGDGTGQIVFNGDDLQRYHRGNAAFLEGDFQFTVSPASQVDLDTSLLYSTTGGGMEIFGKLIVGSANPGGALQAGMGSNTDMVDGVIFHPGAVLSFGGQATQFLAATPDLSAIEVVVDNSAGVMLLGNAMIGSLRIESGNLNALNYRLTILDDVNVAPGCALHSSGTVLCNGNNDQEIDLKGSALSNVTIAGEDRKIIFSTSATITGLISFEGSGLTLMTGDSLCLRSTSVSLGGRIGPLANGNSVQGKVKFERFMPAGRVYRYIAMPVSGARVSDLMDDFPVTGSFENPSTGPGINPTTPSFFYYDAASASWRNHPNGGTAEACLLAPAKGYSAFIRSVSEPVTWDVTGEINQGEIVLPVTAGNGTSPGWNLVGNPYPCAIRWNNEGWTRQGISAGIAVRDNDTGSFRIWDGEAGDLEDGVIAPGQAFWVRATTGSPGLIATESVKEIARGEFYRREFAPDFIRITAAQAGHQDHAWLRKVNGSSIELDPFDIPKLKGDHISVVLKTSLGQRLALSARHELTCVHHEPIDILSTNVTDTIYVALKASGIFELSDLELHNPLSSEVIPRARDGRYIIPPGVTSLNLSVTSAPAQRVHVQLPEFVCDGKLVKGFITNYTAQNQVRVEELTGTSPTSGPWTVSDSLSFTYDRGKDYRIISKSVCDADTAELTIFERRPQAPAPVEQSRCGPGPVSFSMVTKEGVSYNWYNPDGMFLVAGDTFTTPPLHKGADYVIREVDLKSGCEGDPAMASARIETLDSLTITPRRGVLMVNAIPPVEWYRNGQLLTETGPLISAPKEGVYKVKKASQTGRCVAAASYEYRPVTIAVYPNPTSSYVDYLHSSNNPILKDILGVNGVSVLYLCGQVCFGDTCRLDVRSLGAGTYFLIFNDQGKFFRTCISVY